MSRTKAKHVERAHQNIALIRLSNFALLILVAGLQARLEIKIPDYVYLVIICAILGLDLPTVLKIVLKR